MSKLALFFRDKPVTALFLALVLGVFVMHVSHRTEHFQECDSTHVYEALHNFPAASLSFNSYVSHGSFISSEQAQQILSWEPVQALMSFYRERYHVTDEEEFDARVVRALTRLNPVTAFRATYLTALSQAPIPFFAQSFFALPTATTYSPGAGFLFGSIADGGTSYDDFMARGTFMTLSLFALSALLLYATGLKLGIAPLVSALAGTLFLFSISMYSYGYHLGSTIFNVTAAFAWMYFFVRYRGASDMPKKVSIVTAALFFFSYFIAIYWLAFALFWVSAASHDRRWTELLLNVIRKTGIFLKTQKLALVSFLFVGLFFYPPGESYRGFLSVAALPALFYKIILNFFGFYNQNAILSGIQFVIAMMLVAVGLRICFARGSAVEAGHRSLYRFFLALGGVYFLMVTARVLAFFPSRHILVFAAPLFIFVALTLHYVADRFRARSGRLLVVFWIISIVAGFASLFPRFAETRDRFALYPIDPDVDKVFIYDCTASLAYKDWNLAVPVEAVKPASFAPQEGATYLYASPAVPFKQFQAALDAEKLNATRVPSMKILSESYNTSGACFIGFPLDTMSCGFGGRNQIYKARFRVVPSEPPRRIEV